MVKQSKLRKMAKKADKKAAERATKRAKKRKTKISQVGCPNGIFICLVRQDPRGDILAFSRPIKQACGAKTSAAYLELTPQLVTFNGNRDHHWEISRYPCHLRHRAAWYALRLLSFWVCRRICDDGCRSGDVDRVVVIKCYNGVALHLVNQTNQLNINKYRGTRGIFAHRKRGHRFSSALRTAILRRTHPLSHIQP